jgi:hypothetical protein
MKFPCIFSHLRQSQIVSYATNFFMWGRPHSAKQGVQMGRPPISAKQGGSGASCAIQGTYRRRGLTVRRRQNASPSAVASPQRPPPGGAPTVLQPHPLSRGRPQVFVTV